MIILRRSTARGYAIAVASTCLLLLIDWQLPGAPRNFLLSVVFILSVVLSSAVGGWKPGALTTVLGMTVHLLVFLEPRFALKIPSTSELLRILAYCIAGGSISSLSELLHRAWARVAERQHQLEQAERAAQLESLRSRQQAELLQVTLAGIGDAVISTDAAGNVTFLNPVAESLTGWTQAEAVGRPLPEVFRIINERTREPVENPALKALKTRTVVGLANHTLLLSRDGYEHAIDDSAAPIGEPGAEPLGAVLVFRDVSDRRRVEDALQRLATIVASSDDAIFSVSLDGVIQTWNAGAERLLEFAPAEAVGQPISIIIPPDRWDEERQSLNRLARGERFQHLDTVWVSKGGRRLSISLSASPLRDAEGRIVGASQVARDMTERVASERQLAESRARLDYTVRLSGVGFWYCDLPFDVLNWDERVKGHFWLPADAVITIDTFYDQIHPDDREPTRQAIDTAIRNHAPYDVVYRTVDGATGDCKHVRALGGATYGPDGTAIRFDGVTVDITDFKRAEETLREADTRKDEFIALLAHELRNPLAPLRNGLEVLRLAGGDAAMIADAQQMMDRQLAHMVRLVDDLLDISRISRNKMDLRRTRLLLSDVIHNAVETVRPVIQDAGVELAVSLPDEPVYLDADLTRLAQVFSNLLSNSAKFTKRGGRISFTATRCDSQVVIAVQDTGIGIPADAIANIFDMFSQLDRSLERSKGGLGIGLALVKGLVEMHGGTVAAASEGPGAGSTFTVSLPVMLQEHMPPSSSPEDVRQRPATKRRILVVDDNRDSAQTMAMMLRLIGNEVTTAHDGLEALEVAEGFRPQVVVMDIGMPRLNGYDATRKLRAEPWARDMFIIALTGWGQESDQERSREAGFNRHLVKPVKLDDLLALLAELNAGNGS